MSDRRTGLFPEEVGMSGCSPYERCKILNRDEDGLTEVIPEENGYVRSKPRLPSSREPDSDERALNSASWLRIDQYLGRRATRWVKQVDEA